MYGEAWISAIPEGPGGKAIKSNWLDVLDKLTEEQVKKALNKILYAKTEFTRFPPNPMQFYELANVKEFERAKVLLGEPDKEPVTLLRLYWMAKARKLVGRPNFVQEEILAFCELHNLTVSEILLESFVKGNLEAVATFLGVG